MGVEEWFGLDNQTLVEQCSAPIEANPDISGIGVSTSHSAS